MDPGEFSVAYTGLRGNTTDRVGERLEIASVEEIRSGSHIRSGIQHSMPLQLGYWRHTGTRLYNLSVDLEG